MESASTPPAWLLPAILIAFPIFFVALWSSVCGLLAVLSGFRSLGTYRIDAPDSPHARPIATPRFAKIGVVSYKGGILRLSSGSEGLTIRVHRLFPFHGAILVPWEQVALDGGAHGWSKLHRVLLDGRVRLSVPGETAQGIREALAVHGS